MGFAILNGRPAQTLRAGGFGGAELLHYQVERRVESLCNFRTGCAQKTKEEISIQGKLVAQRVRSLRTNQESLRSPPCGAYVNRERIHFFERGFIGTRVHRIVSKREHGHGRYMLCERLCISDIKTKTAL